MTEDIIEKKGLVRPQAVFRIQIYWTRFAGPEPDPDPGFTESSYHQDPDPDQFFQFERIYSRKQLIPKNAIYFFLKKDTGESSCSPEHSSKHIICPFGSIFSWLHPNPSPFESGSKLDPDPIKA